MFNTYSFRELADFASYLFNGARVSITPFGYPVTFTDVAAAATQTQVLRLLANSNFLLTSISGVQTTAALFHAATIQIVDSGSNEKFFDAAVPLDVLWGTNGVRALTFPRYISGNASLSVTLTNNSAGSYTAPQIYLEGVLCEVYS